LSRYELFIKCKACREGNHHECSYDKNSHDDIVQIICSCLDCNRQRKAIEEGDIDKCNSKIVQVLEQVEPPFSNTNRSYSHSLCEER
jgi:hypothetical protein